MMNKPLVTVGISAYNHELYIRDAIESIVNQSYGFENIELIVIDDNSSDTTVKIIEELNEIYMFKFIKNTFNMGLCFNKNRIIELSTGKYICGCASDDKYLPDKIETQVNFLTSNNDIMMCYGKVIKLKGVNKIYNNSNKYKSGWIFEELIKSIFFIPSVTYMVRREVYKHVGKYDLSLHIEDWDMWLRISNKFQIGFINKYLAFYRIHDSNLHKRIELMESDKRKILKKWERNEFYEEALINLELKSFRNNAIYNKKKSINKIPLIYTKIFTSVFLQGLIRLFIPKVIHKALA